MRNDDDTLPVVKFLCRVSSARSASASGHVWGDGVLQVECSGLDERQHASQRGGETVASEDLQLAPDEHRGWLDRDRLGAEAGDHSSTPIARDATACVMVSAPPTHSAGRESPLRR